MKKISTFAERLQELLITKNMRPVDLISAAAPLCEERHIILSKSSISRYLSEQVIPKRDRVELLSDVLDVSPAWLMGYDVPKNKTPLIHPTTHDIDGVALDDLILTQYGEDTLDAFHALVELSPVDLGRTIAYMEQLLASEKYSKKECVI